MSWPDEMQCFSPQQLLVSLLSYLFCSPNLFLWIGEILFHKNTLLHNSDQSPLKELALTSWACYVYSRLSGYPHSFQMNAFFLRISKILNLLFNACDHQNQSNFYLILSCSAADSLRRRTSGATSSINDIDCRRQRVVRLVGLNSLSPGVIPLKGSDDKKNYNNKNLNSIFTLWCFTLFK